MKWAMIAAAALVQAAIVAVIAVALSHRAGAEPGNVWCKAVQPGAQYESNSVRYQLVPMEPGTTPEQTCASIDGWQTFVPSGPP